MANVRLVGASRHRVGAKACSKRTNKKNVVKGDWSLVCRAACEESRIESVSPTRKSDPVTRICSSKRRARFNASAVDEHRMDERCRGTNDSISAVDAAR